MTESLSPTILASISNLINYSTLQTVLLDIVKTIESLSRDVTTVKATVFQLAEDKVSKSEFNVFVGAMAGLQSKVDALDARFAKASDDATNAQALRRDLESQIEKMRQQIMELEAKLNKSRVASFSGPAPVDAEEIRKLHMLLAQKVDVDTFRDFREQMLKGEQNHASLKRSIQDALDALNAKAAATEKYENEMRQRQQQFFDALKTYNDKLQQLESLKEQLASKVDIAEFDARMREIEIKLQQDLGEKEDKIRELYNALRKKADIVQLMELEQIIGTIMNSEGGGTAAGKTHFKCLSCDRGHTAISGSTIDLGSITNRESLRKSTGSPNTGRKVMMVGTDGLVYQGRDSLGIPEAEDVTPPSSARNRPPSPNPMTSSATRKPRPQSAKRV